MCGTKDFHREHCFISGRLSSFVVWKLFYGGQFTKSWLILLHATGWIENSAFSFHFSSPRCTHMLATTFLFGVLYHVIPTFVSHKSPQPREDKTQRPWLDGSRKLRWTPPSIVSLQLFVPFMLLLLLLNPLIDWVTCESGIGIKQ